jgi:DNA polymerase III delta subunit
MKNLKDLKEDILANKINKFYVFYGEDFGLRKHYIDYLSKKYSKKTIVNNALNLSNSFGGGNLFKTTTLYVVPGDLDFARLKKDKIEEFITKIDKNDCVILDYEDDITNTSLYKNFDENVTYFPEVSDNIAQQFVQSELKLDIASKEELAKNCHNNYNKILLEADKIRSFAQAKNISEQAAYNELFTQNQLLFEYPEFHSYALMDDILKGNFRALSFWYHIVQEKFQEQFWIALESIFQDYIIAYLIVKYGKYQGGNIAYEYKYNWGRIKTIRDYIIPYDADSLLQTAYEVAKLDEMIKTGKLAKEKLFDYFLCVVI